MATLGFRAVTGMVLVGALFSSTSYAQQACDRACLTKVIDNYFAALVAHDSTKLPQAAKARITENGAEKKLAQTFWDGAAEVVYRWDIVNTKRGDTGTEVVVRNADGSKTMMVLRLKVINGVVLSTEYRLVTGRGELPPRGVGLGADPSGQHLLLTIRTQGGLVTGWIGPKGLRPLPAPRQPYSGLPVTAW